MFVHGCHGTDHLVSNFFGFEGHFKKTLWKKLGRMRQKLAFQKNLLKLQIMQNKYSPFSADL